MTPEQLLYAALVIVTGWLGVAVKILWSDSKDCKAERAKMREDILKLTAQSAMLEAQVKAMQNCPSRECPMRRTA